MKRIYTAYGMENGKLVQKFDVTYNASLPIGALGPLAPGNDCHGELGLPRQGGRPDADASAGPESANEP